jgi:hypothetical protein
MFDGSHCEDGRIGGFKYRLSRYLFRKRRASNGLTVTEEMNEGGEGKVVVKKRGHGSASRRRLASNGVALSCTS